ncbi:hypothetical protein BUALT_Bualt01G0136400 [Buddleja alternifolia]|uniref:LOB domain-containing protein n=1 Tax=Buddleja alternifolia TaxID=168488 RepID=A0AAV6YDE4_9LAMI|nr:hypothetical protein BUALT_Bualt01G0136400 [Buddleja alternifolia]
MSFISAVPQTKRPALFQSLLFEACGRTVNPVNGAVGLLSTGNWHICQTAVDTVLAGGALRPMSTPLKTDDEPSEAIGWRGSGNTSEKHKAVVMHGFIREYGAASIGGNCLENTASFGSGLSEDSPEFGGGEKGGVGRKEPKLLNLFG